MMACSISRGLPGGIAVQVGGGTGPPIGGGTTIGDNDQRFVLASSFGYGFVTRFENFTGRNKAGKALLNLDAGAEVLLPVAGNDPAQDWLVSVSSAGQLLAFPIAELPELDRGLTLARTMIDLGTDHGCPVVALLTAMDRPLGRACGNALEVEESIAALRGEGPADLMDVTYALGAEMLVLGGVAATRNEARRRMEVAISSGRAARKFQAIIEAQGGNPAVVDDPGLLPQAAEVELFVAARDGVVAQVEPRAIGRGITAMGGGRTKVEDTVDPAVGFVITARPGDVVRAGEPLATIFARDTAGVEAGRAALRASIRLADDADPPLPLISHRVTAAGVERYEAEE
jgi:hypothetical protein